MVKQKTARLIAFYLPQYHPIPENDRWWGKGFTEWTNVARAKPLFRGHQQPVQPSDLGYYDLRVPETREAQAELAQQHGIEGFCYWHYWFGNGKRLLERPFTEVLQSGKPLFPFCLAWANHDWSGIWHGAPDKMLMKQDYPGQEDYYRHFEALLPAFKDHRYISVEGKPLFVLYHPYHMPNCREFVAYWRQLAVASGLAGMYFIGIGAEDFNPVQFDLDGSTTNPPMNVVRRIRQNPGILGRLIKKKVQPQIIDYSDFVACCFSNRVLDESHYPCVMPNWDNTPRSGHNGVVLVNSTPKLYRQHLEEGIGIVSSRSADKRLVFIKSWNEWAEGNYLEPDATWGRQYLEETLEAAVFVPDGSDQR